VLDKFSKLLISMDLDPLSGNITDEEILIYAKWIIKKPFGWKKGKPRWAAVKDVFGSGSTTAHKLCKWAEVDPEELKK
jgi:hypothetical protein